MKMFTIDNGLNSSPFCKEAISTEIALAFYEGRQDELNTSSVIKKFMILARK